MIRLGKLGGESPIFDLECDIRVSRVGFRRCSGCLDCLASTSTLEKGEIAVIMIPMLFESRLRAFRVDLGDAVQPCETPNQDCFGRLALFEMRGKLTSPGGWTLGYPARHGT